MRIKIFDYNIQQHHHHVLIVCSESLFDAYTFHIYDGSLLHNLNIFIILWICLLFFGSQNWIFFSPFFSFPFYVFQMTLTILMMIIDLSVFVSVPLIIYRPHHIKHTMREREIGYSIATERKKFWGTKQIFSIFIYPFIHSLNWPIFQEEKKMKQ